LESCLADVEQNHAKVSGSARRNSALGGCGARVFRLADAGFTSPELFVLLRTDGRNAAGLEIPFQPHLLRVGGAVSAKGFNEKPKKAQRFFREGKSGQWQAV